MGDDHIRGKELDHIWVDEFPVNQPSTATEIKLRMDEAKHTHLSPGLWQKKIMDDFIDAQQYAAGSVIIRKPQMPDANGITLPIEMLFMRLRIGKFDPRGVTMLQVDLPFNYIDAYLKDGKAYVFVVNKTNEAVILEDDVNLFPSDKLITELRLIAG